MANATAARRAKRRRQFVELFAKADNWRSAWTRTPIKLDAGGSWLGFPAGCKRHLINTAKVKRIMGEPHMDNRTLYPIMAAGIDQLIRDRKIDGEDPENVARLADVRRHAAKEPAKENKPPTTANRRKAPRTNPGRSKPPGGPVQR